MRLRDGGTIIIVIVAVAALVGYLSSSWLGDDNELEEFTEEVIKSKTGLDIDLSPKSPEKEAKR